MLLNRTSNSKESLEVKMDEKTAKMVRDHADYKKKREDQYKISSRDRLAKILKKKIETTMIGALSSVEDHFGFLWKDDDSEELSQERQEMKRLFQLIRSDILDKGNTQARNIDAELAQYDVHWNRYTMTLPVKQTLEKKEQQDER